MPDTYFSRFMLSEENDKESEPNYIISGLKDITESTDLNTIGSRTSIFISKFAAVDAGN